MTRLSTNSDNRVTVSHSEKVRRGKAAVVSARAQKVRDLASRGGTLSDVVEAGFPSKEALWVFCKRNGLKAVYAELHSRTIQVDRKTLRLPTKFLPIASPTWLDVVVR